MIEVEVTVPVLNKLPIYADFQVPEIWRYDGVRVVILHLAGTDYVEHERSLAFSPAVAQDLTRLVHQSASLTSSEWLAELRNWIRGLRKGDIDSA